MPSTKDVLDDLRSLSNFAYEQGYHEMGYDPNAYIEKKIAELQAIAGCE